MTIAILGSGSMGKGIAQVAAAAGHTTLLADTNTAALQKAEADLEKTFQTLAQKGKITQEAAEAAFKRLKLTSDIADFAPAGLVIEAIIEQLDIKKSVFKQLESIVAADAVLGSNTSSLSITAIAAACSQPQRVIGIHFFNPAPLMPLVEIIPAVQTNPHLAAQICTLIQGWGKTTVVAKDTPGFIVNRIARPFYGEAIRIYEEGIATKETIDRTMKILGGFRMGPFELMDFIGNDINYMVTETVWQSFFYDPRYRPSFTQKRLVEAGWLGKKTGRGHYNYAPDAPKTDSPNEDTAVATLIFERILSMLINEAADALYLNIASAQDIDLAMTLGTNYPKGLLHWADEFGISKCLQILDGLYDEYREDRYRASVLLRRKARSCSHFWESESK